MCGIYDLVTEHGEMCPDGIPIIPLCKIPAELWSVHGMVQKLLDTYNTGAIEPYVRYGCIPCIPRHLVVANLQSGDRPKTLDFRHTMLPETVTDTWTF